MKNWFKVNNKSQTDPAEILIYDEIGADWFSEDGTSAKSFTKALNDIPRNKPLVVGINSPGGNVWDGLAIYNALVRRGNVTTRIDGVAASIASVIAMAGDTIEMPTNALMMIHETRGSAYGTSADFTKLAAELHKHDEVLTGIYAGKTGLSESRIRELMAEETWMKGMEAKRLGFVDVNTDTIELTACIQDFDLSRFRRVPEPIGGDSASTPRTQPQVNSAMNKDTTPVAVEPTNKASTAPAPPQKKEPTSTDHKTAADTNLVIDLQGKINALEARANKERELRVRGELARVVGINEVDTWLPTALADESVIGRLEKIMPKHEPLPVPSTIENHGHPFLAYKQKKDWKERWPDLKRNYNEYWQAAANEDRRRGMVPMAVNTFSSTLTTSMLADGVITDLQHLTAPLRAYNTQFSPDPLKPNATVVVKNITAGPTVLTIDTSTSTYESGNSTWAAISVTVAQYVSAFHIDNFDIQSGGRLMDLASMAASKLSAQINTVTTTLLTTTNYSTNSGVTSASAAFGMSEMKDLWGQLEKTGRKSILLDGPYYAQILPSTKDDFGPMNPSAFGWDGIYLLTDWSNASNNIVGFACHPQAMCCVTGVPMQFVGVDASNLSRTDFTIPDAEVTIAMHQWFNNSTRTMWASYDIMFGAAVGDETAGAPVKSE